MNTETKKPPICRVCLWADTHAGIMRCSHPTQERDIVWGRPALAVTARRDPSPAHPGGHCGQEGRHFCARPTPSPKPEGPPLQAAVIHQIKPWWLPSFLWRGK